MLQVATDLESTFNCGASKTGATNGTILDDEFSLQKFDLGVSTAEVYPLCLCLSNSNESCIFPQTYYEAGFLTIRGAFRGQLFECTRGITCTFFVSGAGLSSRDLVMIIEMDQVCGVDSPIRQMFGQNPRYQSILSEKKCHKQLHTCTYLNLVKHAWINSSNETWGVTS